MAAIWAAMVTRQGRGQLQLSSIMHSRQTVFIFSKLFTIQLKGSAGVYPRLRSEAEAAQKMKRRKKRKREKSGKETDGLAEDTAVGDDVSAADELGPFQVIIPVQSSKHHLCGTIFD